MSEALRKAAEQALSILQDIHPGNMTPMAEDAWVRASQRLYAALAEPEQSEPVAWRKPMLPTDYDYDGNDWRFSESGFIEPEGQEPLFTRPPRREPLSDEQIQAIRADCANTPPELSGKAYGWAINFARAIEQAHGITGEKT